MLHYIPFYDIWSQWLSKLTKRGYAYICHCPTYMYMLNQIFTILNITVGCKQLLKLPSSWPNMFVIDVVEHSSPPFEKPFYTAF